MPPTRHPHSLVSPLEAFPKPQHQPEPSRVQYQHRWSRLGGLSQIVLEAFEAASEYLRIRSLYK